MFYSKDPSKVIKKYAGGGFLLSYSTAIPRVNNSREGECLTVYRPV